MQQDNALWSILSSGQGELGMWMCVLLHLEWWGTGKPGVLHSMGSQRAGHDLATEQEQQAWSWLHSRYSLEAKSMGFLTPSPTACLCPCPSWGLYNLTIALYTTMRESSFLTFETCMLKIVWSQIFQIIFCLAFLYFRRGRGCIRMCQSISLI